MVAPSAADSAATFSASSPRPAPPCPETCGGGYPAFIEVESVHRQFLVMVSCRFRIARATVVIAASSAVGRRARQRRFAHVQQVAAPSAGAASKRARFLRYSASRSAAAPPPSACGSARAGRPNPDAAASTCAPPSFTNMLREHARRFHVNRIVQQIQRLQRRIRSSRDSPCTPRASARRTSPGSDAGMSAARTCRRRGGTGRRRGSPNIRAWESSASPDSHPADRAARSGPPNFSTSSPETSSAISRTTLRIHAEAALPREQPVVRIALVQLRIRHRRLPVRVAHHDRANQVLHVPGVRSRRRATAAA